MKADGFKKHITIKLTVVKSRIELRKVLNAHPTYDQL